MGSSWWLSKLVYRGVIRQRKPRRKRARRETFGIANHTQQLEQRLVLDASGPTPIINGPTDPTNRDPFEVTVDFGEVVTGFAIGDLVIGNGTASNLVDNAAGAFTVTIDAASNGQVTIDIPADAAFDATTRGNMAADQFVITVDTIATTPVIASTESSPTSLALIPLLVTFGEDVVGFDATDLEVIGGTVSNFIGVGSSYTFDVTPAADGAVTVDIHARATVDLAGNSTFAATQFSIVSERLVPAASISGPSSPGNSDPFDVTVSFGETVFGFVAGNVEVTNGSVVEIQDVGNGDFTVTIDVDAQGVVTVNVPADVAQDGAGNNNTAAAEYTVEIDSIAPTPVISSTVTGPTAAYVIAVGVTFDEDVTGFESDDLTVSGGTVSNFSGSGTSYSFDLTPSNDGLITVDLTADQAHDTAGNGNLSAAQFEILSDRTSPIPVITTPENPTNNDAITVSVSFGEVVDGFISADLIVTHADVTNFVDEGAGDFTLTLAPISDGTITVDIAAGAAQDLASNGNIAATQLVITADTVGSTPVITSTEASPSNNSAIPIRVNFNEAVVGFEETDVVVTGGTISDFAGSDDSYSFVIAPDDDGEVTVSIPAGVASDLAGNATFEAAPLAIAFDGTAPSVSVVIQKATLDASKSESLVTLEFSEPVVDITLADLSANGGSLSNLTKIDDDSYAVTFTASLDVELTGSVTINDTYTDLAGNAGASEQDTVTVDTAYPAVVSINRNGDVLTNANSVSFVISFDSHVSGIEFADFEVVTAGTVVTSIGSVSSSTNTTATVVVDGVSGDGIVALNFVPTASGSVLDAVGNPALSSFTGQEFVIDNTSPTVDIADVSPDPRSAGVGVIDIQFSERVLGVETADFKLTRDNKAVSLPLSALSGMDDMRTLDVTGLSHVVGLYSLALSASRAGITDVAGNALTVDASDVWQVVGGISVTETDGETVVNERGASDTFSIALTTQPTRSVVLNVISNDTTEARVSHKTLTFTASNWNQPQVVTVTGQSDTELADGDVMTTIDITVDASSSDSAFAVATGRSVSVLNKSHFTSTIIVLNGTGRPTDYIDVIGDDQLDLELRNENGQILSPGIDDRISLAGYPAGTYELWVNDEARNYIVRPNPGLGQASGDPPLQALDLDGNGRFNFANDGLLLLAYSLGMRGGELNPYRGPGESRTANEIQTLIEQLADALDFDGDGKFDFGTDGLLLLAYSLGSGPQQLAELGGPDSFRDGDQIVDRLNGLTTNARPREQTPDASASGFVILIDQAPVVSPSVVMPQAEIATVPPIDSASETPTSPSTAPQSDPTADQDRLSDGASMDGNVPRDEFFSAADDLEQDLMAFN